MTLRRLLLACVACALGPGFAGPAAADDGATGHLVVVLADRLEPAELVVRPGEPVVWLNRTSGAMIAFTFDDAFAPPPGGCEIARSFLPIEGTAPFTSLLAPGSIAALCAPPTGTYRYAVSGDVALAGVVRVVEAR